MTPPTISQAARNAASVIDENCLFLDGDPGYESCFLDKSTAAIFIQSAIDAEKATLLAALERMAEARGTDTQNRLCKLETDTHCLAETSPKYSAP